MTSRTHAPKNPYFVATNPKDLVAQTRLDLSTIPDNYEIELGLAFFEGALKYGRYNWRMAPVKASVYYSAIRRHLLKYMSGEEVDKKTKTHHMAYIGCCAAIIFDATVHGTLVDDRPPRSRRNVPVSSNLDTLVVKRIKHLQTMFKDQTPKQYTIQDRFIAPKQVSHIESRLQQRRSRVRSKGRSAERRKR